MRDLFLLSAQQVDKLQVFFPSSRGVPRVDDRLVLSGIIFVQRNGLRWLSIGHTRRSTTADIVGA